MKFIASNSIFRAAIVTVLICLGFWVYTQWDLNRFEASLGKTPVVQSRPDLQVPSEQVSVPISPATGTVDLLPSVTDIENENLGPTATAPLLAEFTEEGTIDAETEFEDFLDMFLEETAMLGVTSGDFMDPIADGPYDQAFVNTGFQDYKASLEIAPEYAYQRLEEALREQLNDDPEVSRLVDTIRKSNEGTLNLNEGIQSTALMMRLVSKVSPPEALAGFENHFQTLRELQALEFESGSHVIYDVKFVIGE